MQAQLIPFGFWKAHDLFTWIAGSNVQTLSGIYGTQGTGSSSNNPGQRYQSTSWTDGSGNLWLFGGFGFDVNGNQTILNDLWKYTVSGGTWTFEKGSSMGYQNPSYGTKGTAAAANVPGSRAEAASWIDSSGSLWLFGGNGLDNAGNWTYLNDLWKYSPGTNQWTWISGSNTGNKSGVYGTLGTGSTSNYPGGRGTAVGWPDSSGNFWIFGGFGIDSAGSSNQMNDLWMYVPGTGKWTWISGSSTGGAAAVYGTQGTGSTSNTPGSRSDSAGWQDGSGNFWIFGGNSYLTVSTSGAINDLWEFTPSTKKWTWVAGPNTLQASGTYGTEGVGSTSNIPGARFGYLALKDGSGIFWLFGGLGYDSLGAFGVLNDVWKFDPSTKNWTWSSGANLVNQAATYGTKGTGSAGNIIGPREYSVGSLDLSGNFWFFGGNGIDGAGNQTSLNDLWEYTPSNGNWAWMTGPSANLQMGKYGTKGVGSASGLPSARSQANTWVDSNGLFWLLGGTGIDNQGNEGLMNDLWSYAPGTQTWTWVSGDNIQGQSSIYGTKGAGSTGNKPGGRIGAVPWADTSGNLWIFGGTGVDSAGNTGYLSDLWKYTQSNGQWTWVSGNSLQDQVAVYGTKGTGSTSNIPGPRDTAVSWIDLSGNLWLFGGLAKDSAGIYDYANDLWEYAPGSGKWTWVTGSNVRNQGGTYGVQGSGSTSNTPGARNSAVAWRDSAGVFWLFGGLGYDGAGIGGYLNDLWQYNPSNGQWTWISGASAVAQAGVYGTKGTGNTSNIPGARQGAVSWMDRAGNLWLAGGYGYDSTGVANLLNDVWKYSPSTNQWTWMAGSNLAQQNGTYGSLGIPSPATSPGGGQQSAAWVDTNGTAWIFSGTGLDSIGTMGPMNAFWKFSP